MTTGKRALIVDDSRSARVILSRMLEQHGMAVDTAESAEQALEYLQQAPSRRDLHGSPDARAWTGSRPSRPSRATPRPRPSRCMMYTSQEGELYVSQARALGAVGRAAEDGPAGRRVARPLPAAPAAGSAPAAHDAVRRAAAAALSASAAGSWPPAPARPDGAAAWAPRRLRTRRRRRGRQPGRSPDRGAGRTVRPSLRQSIQQLVKDQLGGATPLHAGDVRGLRAPARHARSRRTRRKAPTRRRQSTRCRRAAASPVVAGRADGAAGRDPGGGARGL